MWWLFLQASWALVRRGSWLGSSIKNLQTSTPARESLSNRVEACSIASATFPLNPGSSSPPGRSSSTWPVAFTRICLQPMSLNLLQKLPPLAYKQILHLLLLFPLHLPLPLPLSLKSAPNLPHHLQRVILASPWSGWSKHHRVLRVWQC